MLLINRKCSCNLCDNFPQIHNFLGICTVLDFMMTECKRNIFGLKTYLQCIPHTCTLTDPLILKCHALLCPFLKPAVLSCIFFSLDYFEISDHKQKTCIFIKKRVNVLYFYSNIFLYSLTRWLFSTHL